MKKSSHSKKVMKMLDKERRKKKNRDVGGSASFGGVSSHSSNGLSAEAYGRLPDDGNDDVVLQTTSKNSSSVSHTDDNLDSKKRQKNLNSNSSIHTEIRTDDFVVRLLLSFAIHNSY